MSSLAVLTLKEFRNLFRSFAFIWVPIVLIVQNLSTPLLYKFLPIILENLPEAEKDAFETLISPSTDLILSEVVISLSQIGIIIAALLMMGSIVTEKNNGLTDTILSRKVTSNSYVLSKYIAYVSLFFISIVTSGLATYYYTVNLFDAFEVTIFIKSLSLICLLSIFLISIILTVNSFVKTQLQAALLSLAAIFILSFVTSFLPDSIASFSPMYLETFATDTILNISSGNIVITITATLVSILALFLTTTKSLKRTYKK